MTDYSSSKTFPLAMEEEAIIKKAQNNTRMPLQPDRIPLQELQDLGSNANPYNAASNNCTHTNPDDCNGRCFAQ